MAEKTIGQVLRAAREDLNLTISDAYNTLKIHRRYLKALEKDDFEAIPGKHQARDLLMRYAKFLDLDETVILEAYDSKTLLRVYELTPKDPRYGRLTRKKRSRKGNQYLPFISLLLIAGSIIVFMGYTIWNYQSNGPNNIEKEYHLSYDPESAEATETTSLTVSEETVSTSDASTSPTVLIKPLENNPNSFEISELPNQFQLTVAVNEGESWVAVSNTELAGGVLLSHDQKESSITIDKANTPKIDLSIGVVKDLSISLNGQELDLSQITSQPTMITLHFK